MDTQIRRLLAAGAVVGFLTVGGISLASAQEDPTTSTTVEDSTTTPDDSAVDDASREDCPKDAAADDGSAETETEAEGSSV